MTSSHASKSESAPAKGLSLRLILVVPFLLQISLAVGLTGYLSVRNGRQAVNDVATQLRQEVATRIDQKLDDYLDDPHLVNRLNRDAVSLGYLDPSSLEALNQHFFYQAKLFPTVASFLWGSETEQFIGTGSFYGRDYQRMEAGTHLGGSIRFYAVDEQGRSTKLLSETPNFPIRSRPWYTAAVSAGKPTWGEIFPYHAYPIMAMPASVPVYDETNRLIGVFATNFFLDQISDFLKQIEIGQSGQTFIIERSGLLVASSTLDQPFIVNNNQAQRINVFETDDPLIRGAATFLRDEYGDLNQIYSLQQLTTELNGERQFLQVDAYRDQWGLDWLVVVMVPESDFMAQIIANRNRTILFCLLALGASAGAGVFTSRWIAQPLTRLTQAADAIADADGKMQPQLKPSWIREFQSLTQSFQRMAQQIQLSLALLESRVAERTASLAQTNEQLQQSEQRYRGIIEDQTELICRYQPDGTLTFVNQAYCRYFDKTEAELVGHQFLPMIPIEDIPAVQELIDSLSPENPYVICEHRVIKPDGSIRWQQWNDRVILNDAGQVVEYQGVGRDITAQKQAETQLLEKSNTDRAMAQIVDQMRRSLKIETILDDTTIAVHQVFKCDRVAIYQFNPDWSGTFVAESVDSAYPRLVGNGIQTTWADLHLQQTQGGCFQKGDIHQANDTRVDIVPSCYRQMLEQFKIRAYIISPVFQQNRLWGLLAVYQHQHPRLWTSEDARLMTHVGKQLGIALHQADLLIQVRQKSNELQRASEAAEAEIRRQLQKQAATANAVDAVVDRTRAFLDVDTIFSTVTHEARKLLSVDCVAVYQFNLDETGEFVAESIAPNKRSLIARQSQNPGLKLNIGDRRIIQLIHDSKPYFSRTNSDSPSNSPSASQSQSSTASSTTASTVSSTVPLTAGDMATVDMAEDSSDKTVTELEHLNQALVQVEQKFSPPTVNSDLNADLSLRSQFADADAASFDPADSGIADYYADDASFTQSASAAAKIESFVANDVYSRQFSDCYIQALEEYQIRAYIIAPIFQGNHLWGMLTAYQQTEPRQWEPWEVKAMIRLGKQLGIALRQAEYVREVREKSRQVIQALQSEAVMRQARDAADASNRAKSEFLSHMSHELRTPLNAILGFTQLMQRETNLPDVQREYLDTINQSGEHLLTLINDILDMSKIEAGRLVLHNTQFDLHDLLASIQNMLQTKAAVKELMFDMELAPDVPRSVIGDEGKLRQILINLLSNAIKFTSTGAVKLRVRLDDAGHEQSSTGATPTHPVCRDAELNNSADNRAGDAGDAIWDAAGDDPVWLYFAIEDTGPGIPSEEVELLFKPFMQTTVGRRSHVGTGLGLTISQKFAQMFGGDICLESTSAKGSTFAVRLPLVRSQIDLLPAYHSYRCPVALAPEQPPLRILVVDDHDYGRRLMVTLLTKVGFQVEEATNGQEAIERWYRWRPHLIWMDMRMPVMSGDQAAADIKSHIDGKATVIIALTASAFEEEKTAILASGCDDFVRKPFQDWLIFEKMAEYLGVQYEYAPEVNSPVDPSLLPIPSVVFDTQYFAQQSPAWLAAVHQAATSADGERILQLASAIADAQPEFAAYLNLLVQNFEFEAIIELSGGHLG